MVTRFLSIQRAVSKLPLDALIGILTVLSSFLLFSMLFKCFPLCMAANCSKSVFLIVNFVRRH